MLIGSNWYKHLITSWVVYSTSLLSQRNYIMTDKTAPHYGAGQLLLFLFYIVFLIGHVLTSNGRSWYLPFKNVFVYNISSWFGQGSLSTKIPTVQNLLTDLKKYFTLVCLMVQNTCHLIVSVLELLSNELLLALTGYNYLGIWIFVHTVYLEVKCENIVIDQNGDIFYLCLTLHHQCR